MLLHPRATQGVNVAAILMNLSFGVAVGEWEGSALLAAAPNLAWAARACRHEPGQERTSAALGALLNMCLASEACRQRVAGGEHFAACLDACLRPARSAEVQLRACDVVFALCRRTHPQGAQQQGAGADPAHTRRCQLLQGNALARLLDVFNAAAGAPLQRAALFAMLELAVEDFERRRDEVPFDACIDTVLAGKDDAGGGGGGPLAESQTRYLARVQRILSRRRAAAATTAPPPRPPLQATDQAARLDHGERSTCMPALPCCCHVAHAPPLAPALLAATGAFPHWHASVCTDRGHLEHPPAGARRQLKLARVMRCSTGAGACARPQASPPRIDVVCVRVAGAGATPCKPGRSVHVAAHGRAQERPVVSWWHHVCVEAVLRSTRRPPATPPRATRASAGCCRHVQHADVDVVRNVVPWVNW